MIVYLKLFYVSLYTEPTLNVISQKSYRTRQMSSENNDYLSTLASKHGFSNNHEKLDDIEFLQIRYTDVPGKFLACYFLKGEGG